MLEPHLHTLAALIAEQPDRTLAELKDALGTSSASLRGSGRDRQKKTVRSEHESTRGLNSPASAVLVEALRGASPSTTTRPPRRPVRFSQRCG